MYVELEAGATGETAGSASVGRADAGLEPRTSSLRGMELVALEGTFAFALELNLPRHCQTSLPPAVVPAKTA
jgi:hypothetical protein